MSSTTATGLSRVLLVADRADRSAAAPGARIRRYRLARLQLDARDVQVARMRQAHR